MTEIMLNQILIMNQVLMPVVIGAAGGAIRIIMDIIKRKQFGFGVTKEAMFVFLAIYLIIGGLSGLLLNSSKILSFLGGYAAVDLMDIYHKSFMKKKIK